MDNSVIDITTYRHSVAHVMAYAVKNLYPEAKLAIGPSIEDGFYYDFELDHHFTPQDLKAIEKEMIKIIKKKIPFELVELPKEEAVNQFSVAGQTYKCELLADISDSTVTMYKNDEFVDLCRGPHLRHTGQIKAFKLLKIAGAYWRGNENNKMLQRIYGTAFFTKDELKDYLNILEESKKRDHRKLGKELDLFSFHEEGPGFAFWHPQGMKLYNNVISYWKDLHTRYDYQEVKTPIILNEKLWHQSGHWDNYRDNMYFVDIDESPFAIKPMNCPGGILVYNHTNRSYKDLPLKLAELGLVHRHERSGVLHGLFRVRQFTQDDAHVYCAPEQIEDEIVSIMDLVDEIYSVFDFEYEVELSTRPEKAIGSDEIWEQAEASLKKALQQKNVEYKLNEGDGAFYGPKIDFHIKDCLGRSWQCGTIQLDFSMPERFDLSYIASDGKKHRPVMIHRAILGSIERFIGILIEHYAGRFPLWLAPTQVYIVPIKESHREYAANIVKELKALKISVKVDDRSEKIGYRIRSSELLKVPYTFIIGDKEVDEQIISIRSKREGDLGSFTLEQIKDKLLDEIINKK